jgi:hypothetical protein
VGKPDAPLWEIEPLDCLSTQSLNWSLIALARPPSCGLANQGTLQMIIGGVTRR